MKKLITKYLNRYLFDGITQDPSFIEKYCSIRYVLPGNIFYLKDDSCGVAFQINGIDDETLTSNELESKLEIIYNTLSRLVSRNPKIDCVIQVIQQSRMIKEDQYTPKNQGENELVNLINNEENNFILNSPLLKRSTYITIRFYKKSTKTKGLPALTSILSLMPDSHINFNTPELSDLYNDLKKELKNIEEGLAQFCPSILTKYSLHQLVMSSLGVEAPTPSALSNNSIHHDFVSPTVDELDNCIKTKHGESTKEGSITVHYLRCTDEDKAFELGKISTFSNNLSSLEWDIVLTLSSPQTELNQAQSVKKGFFWSRKAYNQEANQTYAVFKEFDKNLSIQNPMFNMSLRVLIHNSSERDEHDVKENGKRFLYSNFQKEEQIAKEAYVTALPLNCGRYENNLLSRTKTLLLSECVKYFPCYSKRKVKLDGSPIYMSLNREAQEWNAIPSCEENRLSIVLGQMGSGKGFVVNKVIPQFVMNNPRGPIRIIDNNTSYRPIVEMLGGQVMTYTEQSLINNPISPFAISNPKIEDIKFLETIIFAAMISRNPTIERCSIHSDLLFNALKLSYNVNHASRRKLDTNTNPHPIWDDILAQLPNAANHLSSTGSDDAYSAMKDIIKWSITFSGSGRDSTIFNNYERCFRDDKNEQCIIYDFQNIHDEVVGVVAAMTTILRIAKDYRELPQNIHKLTIIEELGILIRDKAQLNHLLSKEFEKLAKNSRTNNNVIWAISNETRDFKRSPEDESFFQGEKVSTVGETLFEVSAQKIIAPLGAAQLESIQHHWKGIFNIADLQALSILKKEPSFNRSMIYVLSDIPSHELKTTLYIAPSPFAKSYSGSGGSDKYQYTTLRNEGKNPMEAVLAKIEAATKHQQEELNV